MSLAQERRRAAEEAGRFCGIFGRSVFSLGPAARRLHTARRKRRQAGLPHRAGPRPRSGSKPTPDRCLVHAPSSYGVGSGTVAGSPCPPVILVGGKHRGTGGATTGREGER